MEIRKVIYTTNAIESLNRSLRKVIKTKAVFPIKSSNPEHLRSCDERKLIATNFLCLGNNAISRLQNQIPGL
jgi:hypothetical protein